MRIGVVGAGGAGGYFAGRWSEAGLDVTLLARGRHFEAIRDHGLRVFSVLGDFNASLNITDQPGLLAGVDLVIYATKTWQLEAALDSTAEHIAPGTLVFGFQNGVDAVDELAAALPQARVLGATCRIISYIDGPGVIRHMGAEPTVRFGAWGEQEIEGLDELADTLHVEGKVTAAHAPDIMVEVWQKFLFFAPFSGIGAMYGKPIGETRSDPVIREQIVAAMEEVFAIASARGIHLGDGAVEQTLAFTDKLPPDGTSSLQRDVADGKPTELASLSGRVVELGAELGIATPTHSMIVEHLCP